MKKITIKGTPEMKTLAREAQAVQDACNLCGVAQAFARTMKTLVGSDQSEGTTWCNQHPITRMWIAKLEHLARLDQSQGLADYDAIQLLADGEDCEWEISEG